MANIIFDVAALVCEEPVLTDAHYADGYENTFALSWTSLGAYYDVVAPPAMMEISYSVDGGTWEEYPGNPVAFDAVDYLVNFNTYPPAPLSNVVFKLKLSSSECTLESNELTANVPG